MKSGKARRRKSDVLRRAPVGKQPGGLQAQLRVALYPRRPAPFLGISGLEVEYDLEVGRQLEDDASRAEVISAVIGASEIPGERDRDVARSGNGANRAKGGTDVDVAAAGPGIDGAQRRRHPDGAAIGLEHRSIGSIADFDAPPRLFIRRTPRALLPESSSL